MSTATLIVKVIDGLLFVAVLVALARRIREDIRRNREHERDELAREVKRHDVEN